MCTPYAKNSLGPRTVKLYRTQGAEGSQPAMKARRNEDVKNMYRIKDVNVRINVMYNMCECYHRVLQNNYCKLLRNIRRERWVKCEQQSLGL